jgi:hypothetical protein
MPSVSGFEIGRAVSKMIVYDTHVLSITDRESIIYNNNNLKLEFEKMGLLSTIQLRSTIHYTPLTFVVRGFVPKFELSWIGSRSKS